MATYKMADTLTAERVKGMSNPDNPLVPLDIEAVMSRINAIQSNLLASLTLHDCTSHDNRVSSMVAKKCSDSGLVAHTPHQVEDGVLHTAPT